jgi:hypothetical protein
MSNAKAHTDKDPLVSVSSHGVHQDTLEYELCPVAGLEGDRLKPFEQTHPSYTPFSQLALVQVEEKGEFVRRMEVRTGQSVSQL